MSVGSDQHSRRRGDLAEHRKLPHAIVPGVDQPDSIRQRSQVETAGFTEVEEHWPGVVQQGEDARGTVRGLYVEVGHAPPEQRLGCLRHASPFPPGSPITDRSEASPLLCSGPSVEPVAALLEIADDPFTVLDRVGVVVLELRVYP